GSLDLTETLHRILEQAWELVSYQEKPISYASIWLLEGESKVKLVAALPTEELFKTQAILGNEVDWRRGKGGRIGIMGRVIKSGKPELVKDVTQDPDYLESHPNTRSALSVPIRLDKKAIGIINLEHANFDAFDDENAQTLQSLANQAAVAIQNTRLYQTSVHHVALLNAAAAIASHVTGILDEKKLLTETVHLIAERLGFYHVAVFLLGDRREYAVLRAASSEGGQKMLAFGHKLKVGKEGIIGSVARKGEPHLTSNVAKDTHHLANIHLPNTRSEMAFPLSTHGQVIGVLDVQSAKSVTLQPEEVATLQTMANILAHAIHNSRLYDREQKRARTSQALYKASQAITETLDIDRILQTTVEQAWKLTGATGPLAQFSHLALVSGNKLHFEAAYPLQHLSQLRKAAGKIDLERDKHIGVVGRTVISGLPQLIGDVTQDEDYIATDKDVRSELTVPIKVGKNVIGVISVEHPGCNAFDDDDLQALVLLASQTAVVIQNARHYQEAEVLQKVAASLAGPMELIEALNLVMDAAIELTNTDAGSILFWDAEANRFGPAFTTTGPGGKLEMYKTSARASGGIAKEIIESGKPAIIRDTQTRPNINPIAVRKKRRAFIGAPLFSESTAIGVIFVSCTEPRSFSEHQVTLLQTLVSQAVVAIIVARRYEELNEELKEVKGLVGARTALAWMGMASNAWRHSIEGDAVNIRNIVTLLRPQIKKAVAHPTSLEQINAKLGRIERLAAQVLARPITPPLSSEDGVEAVIVNDLIHERMRQLWENGDYKTIDKPYLHLNTTTDVRVWVSPEWLRLALDLVVDNAVEAMQEAEVRRLDVITAVTDNQIEIAIKDTGIGMPPEIQSILFKEPLDQPKREGHLGRGLLMVQAIVHTYSGDVAIGETGPEGTSIILSLPILQES
ncbi:MAG: GAF domain-containing protein, partial [Chloroflexi bacterium]|nr:GAF domain-containing protein [Chloroflexota bacterium]